MTTERAEGQCVHNLPLILIFESWSLIWTSKDPHLGNRKLPATNNLLQHLLLVINNPKYHLLFLQLLRDPRYLHSKPVSLTARPSPSAPSGGTALGLTQGPLKSVACYWQWPTEDVQEAVKAKKAQVSHSYGLAFLFHIRVSFEPAWIFIFSCCLLKLPWWVKDRAQNIVWLMSGLDNLAKNLKMYLCP